MTGVPFPENTGEGAPLKKKRYTEERIIHMLNEIEGGRPRR